MIFPGILVMGATGRLGTILRHVWPRDPDLASATGPVTWQGRRPIPATETLLCDPLADPSPLHQALPPGGTVLCLAGPVPGRMSPDGDLQDHGRLARTAIAAAAARNGRVLLASSAAVYGNQPGSLPETAALRPAAPYGQAKQEMEQIASDEADRLGVPLCLLRIGNIAGIDSILGGWKPGFQLDVLTDGHTPARSYIGPETLARVLGHLCITADLPRELNIATPGLTEMGALLDAADRPWTARPAPPGVIAAVHLDTTRLQQLVPLPSGASHPAQMVAEWQGLEPHMTR